MERRNGALLCCEEGAGNCSIGQTGQTPLRIAFCSYLQLLLVCAPQTLRRGLKNSTWWEDDYDKESSHEWRL